jgi:hypothetical protein
MTRTILATLLALAASTRAADIHWSELPKVLKGRSIIVTTKQGDSYDGQFVSSVPDSLVLKDAVEIKIPRDAIKTIYRKGRDGRFSHLKNLGAIVFMAYFIPFTGIDGESPRPLIALLTIPVGTVGGAIGAPIAFVRDLFELTEPPGEFITVRPEGVI